MTSKRWTMPVAACAGLVAFGLSLPVLAQDKITLTWGAHYTDAQMAPLTACFRRYEQENPTITIRYQQSGIEDFLQTILTSRIGGTSPDIYNVYSIWGKQLTDSGILAEPPSDIADFIAQNYEPTTVKAATLDDKVWGVPAEVSLYMLIYNKALFAEAGIAQPPSTWAEVLEDAKKIAKRDADGKVVTAGYAFGPSVANATHPFRTLMFSAGLPLLKDDLMSTNLADPKAVEILSGEVELFKQGLTSPSNVVKDFPSSRNGMQITANWFKQTLREGMGEDFLDKVGVAPIPAGPDWKTYQYSFYQSVDANSAHPEEAWKLIRWLNSPQATGKRSCVGDMLVALGGLTANNADIAASAEAFGDSFTKPYVDALQSGRALSEPPVAQTAEADRALRSAIEAAWLGQLSPEDALKKADAEITNILALPQ
ncbi:extracellular solute-binding protein [Mesorhizobium sp. RP14(2022)]|uniref:Extracellular solute-binding protein n=1 Tax=Mesorhizobium liriopis TaxID=2953882 RepID=A0ABT1C874_9HYPH|nr:extracellular solute-binding protein [Mesorhizobium liriopis]MCO6050977.1 extracellular solute-binding protein [Mesorhizobium liriopis]